MILGAHWLCSSSASCLDGRDLSHAWDLQGSVAPSSFAEARVTFTVTTFNCQRKFWKFLVCLCNISLLINMNCKLPQGQLMLSVFFDKGVVSYLLFSEVLCII